MSDISNQSAADLMTRDPVCVSPGQTISEAARIMRDEDVGMLPVVAHDEARRLVGVVTDRDIAVRAVADERVTATVGDVMSTSVRTVQQNEPAEAVLQAMRTDRVRRIPVVDEANRLVGIVAQADVLIASDAAPAVARTIERISEPVPTTAAAAGR